jgi:hypothetical protein
MRPSASYTGHLSDQGSGQAIEGMGPLMGQGRAGGWESLGPSV